MRTACAGDGGRAESPGTSAMGDRVFALGHVETETLTDFTPEKALLRSVFSKGESGSV